MHSRSYRMDWASVESWHECWLNAEIQLARRGRAGAMQADQDELWRSSHEILPDGIPSSSFSVVMSAEVAVVIVTGGL